MKNWNLRTILFALLLMTSIGSYVYINTIQVPETNVKCEAKQVFEEEEDDNSAELPDVKIFKKLIEKSKELVPATQF